MLKFLRRKKAKSNINQSPQADALPQATASVPPIPITCEGKSEFYVLISGAGIGDTGGGLCLFDGSCVQTIDRITSAGLALQDGRLARILSTPIVTGSGEILIYDKRGITHYLRLDELSDAHYLVWDKETLVVSSTGTNSIVWISLAGEIIRRRRLPGEDDSWHLNGICLHDNRLYACAFGEYAHYRGYKDRLKEGDGFIFELESGQPVAQGLCAPHNPLWIDGLLTVCDSLRNMVVQFNPVTGQRVRQVQLRAFTRGLAVTDDYLVVGESNQRHEAGKDVEGSFAILRRSNLELLKRFWVPFREISDILVIPTPIADGLRTGFRTNPLRVSETDQLQMFRDVGIEPRRLWAINEKLTPAECKIRVQADIPRSIDAGRLTLVECKITNQGQNFLSSELPYPVYISYKWRRIPNSPEFPHAEGLRTRLPKTLAPGESLSCRIEVQAPELNGEAKLTVTMVQERVLWFDDADASNGCAGVVSISTASRDEGK